MEKAEIKIEIKHSIVVVHGMPVILASDLAKFYNTSVSLVNLYRNPRLVKAFCLIGADVKPTHSADLEFTQDNGTDRYGWLVIAQT